jgi:hypothetical protein
MAALCQILLSVDLIASRSIAEAKWNQDELSPLTADGRGRSGMVLNKSGLDGLDFSGRATF